MFTRKTIQSKNSRATIDLRGAQITSWEVNDIKILYEGESEAWQESCPIMFPACGWSENSVVRIDGDLYEMPVHGFISKQVFDVVKQMPNSICLEHRSDVSTRMNYPFDYSFRATYMIDGATLHSDFVIKNLSKVPLYYSIGIHPGFNWPIESTCKSEWTVEFSHDEEPVVPVVSSKGLLTEKLRHIPLRGRRLPLDDKLFLDEALCFVGARSSELKLAGERCGVKILCADAKHWTIWSLMGERFITIEPSTGHGDYEGSYTDFRERAGITLLRPDEERFFSTKFEFYLK